MQRAFFPPIRAGSRAFFGVRFITKYTKSHEYIKVDNGVGTVGVTDFAQQALGDVVFVGLPEVGASLKKGTTFASVESVKAASDVYIPVSGTVKEVNKGLSEDPAAVNKAAEGTAWFAKISVKDDKELDSLMDAAAYKKHCDSEKH